MQSGTDYLIRPALPNKDGPATGGLRVTLVAVSCRKSVSRKSVGTIANADRECQADPAANLLRARDLFPIMQASARGCAGFRARARARRRAGPRAAPTSWRP